MQMNVQTLVECLCVAFEASGVRVYLLNFLIDLLDVVHIGLCWCSQLISRHRISCTISFSADTDLQRKLFDRSLSDTEVDDDYIHQLAAHIGHNWSTLASLLPLTSEETKRIRSEKEPALAILQRMRPLTYGKLYNLLRTVPLLKPTV